MAPWLMDQKIASHEIPVVNSNGAHAANDKTSHKNSNWVTILESPIHKPRKLRLVCIGAGYAGLMMAYKIKYQMNMEDVIDLCIYEKNHDVGGTWLENRYVSGLRYSRLALMTLFQISWCRLVSA